MAELEEKAEKYCNFCRSPVNSLSKHCVRCNRCTMNFDHHCKWVNNCIGGINYRLFIILISLTQVLEVFLILVSGSILVNSMISHGKVEENIRDFYSARVFPMVIAIESFITLEALVFSGLLAYLLCLHMHLYRKGITTYEFIISKRNKIQIAPRQKASDTMLNLNQSHFEKSSYEIKSSIGIDSKIPPRI